ncbi:MAG: hypothetical protein IT431_09665 [Phycisphaerales bacterium]|nr:hypothetical protein [Phycisphaerales bacterium]
MTKSTWNRVSPRSVHASTVKKSAAAIVSQCARRKVLHGMCLCGAGPRPCSFRMRRTVDRLTRCPRLASAPSIREYPQPGFSAAIRTHSSRIVRMAPGRPLFRLALPSYFRAISSRHTRHLPAHR